RQGATVDQGMIVSLFPVNAIWVNSYGYGGKRRAHDADLKRMVVIRSPSPQLVPFSCIDLGNKAQPGISATTVALSHDPEHESSW
ncbi:hypothetical protein ACV1D9_22330, partial [Aeromonas allosaccharophila]